jgi:hypothetical protein
LQSRDIEHCRADAQTTTIELQNTTSGTSFGLRESTGRSRIVRDRRHEPGEIKMSESIKDKVLSKFPLEEDFVDYSGRTRRFRICIRQLIAEDFYLEAEEISQKQCYRFEIYSSAYSGPALGLALRKLRQKIHKGLSTRYLYTDSEGARHLMHDEMSGLISHDGIMVDGEMLLFRDLERILTTHEGFRVSISIQSAAE